MALSSPTILPGAMNFMVAFNSVVLAYVALAIYWWVYGANTVSKSSKGCGEDR